jgi:hypothetical protein
VKHFNLASKSIIIILALVFSFKVKSQNSVPNPVNLHETFNSTGNNLQGSSGQISYSIGQVFYTVIGQSVNKASQGVQFDYVDQTVWNGSNWDNGVPTSSMDAFIIGTYDVSDNINASSLTVTNNSTTVIPSGFNVKLNEEININSGSFTLKNNSNLIQIFESTNSGNINVDRESSKLFLFDYTLWSSPVKNETSYLQAFSPSTSSIRFYDYNTSTNLYKVIPNPSTTSFALGQGYLIQNPNDGSPSGSTKYLGMFKGVPNNGTIAITLLNEGPGKRFNLVGNPYPSTIIMEQFINDNSTNVTPALYFWRKTNGSRGGAYCTWAGGIFVTNNETEVADPKGIIQTGQGFFVEALESSGTVVFNNGQRIADNSNQFFKSKAVERNTIWLNATNTAGDFTQMAIGYTTNATIGVDSYDGKYFNDGPIALNSVLDNTNYVIQGRPLPFDSSDEVQLSFNATKSGEYTIAIDHVDGIFSSMPGILLKDNLNGTVSNLKLSPYKFTAPSGATNSRFSLKYQSLSLVNEVLSPSVVENSILVFQNREKINISSNSSNIKDVKFFDLNGRLLFENAKLNSKETSCNSSKFGSQVLLVKIRLDDDKLITKKIIVQNSSQ